MEVKGMPTKNASGSIMKLPAVDSSQFFRDGNASTVESHLKEWEVLFAKHTDNERFPFLKTCVPKEHLWRLKDCHTFEGIKQALMELASKEDIFSLNIIDEVLARPKCKDYLEDKMFLTFLSMKLAELISVNPGYHLSQY